MNDPGIDYSSPVGQLARRYPATVPVLEQLDVDYACRGGRPLRDAAVAAGLSPEELVHALAAAAQAGPPADEEPLPVLLEQLIVGHRGFDAAAFASLRARIEKEPPGPELERISRLLHALEGAVRSHSLREERELFPRIEEIVAHPHRVRAGSISQPLLIEFIEHEVIHEWLTKTRELVLRLRSGPADPELLDALDALDRTLHRHIHLENNVLIPRVIDLENRLKNEVRGTFSTA